MTLHHQIRVTCDQCGVSCTANTGDELAAGRILTKRKWRFIRWDMYGNESHVCSESCEKSYREKNKEHLPPLPSVTGKADGGEA